MKIYHVSWFDEDDYGPISGLYLVVQSESPEDALKVVSSTLKDLYNTTVEELNTKYEKFAIEDITDSPVITSGYMGW